MKWLLQLNSDKRKSLTTLKIHSTPIIIYLITTSYIF